MPNATHFPGETVNVELGRRSYPIYVGADVLGQLEAVFEQNTGHRRVVVITDDNVKALYGQKVTALLKEAGREVHLLSVPAGESSKRLAIAERLFDQLFDVALERSDVIAALGGGVVGDLAGFVAATFKRGVNYVQIPTTLLAMVDSSIGGKTGINHPRGKNMIGVFYQPKMVFADVATLKTLPRREWGCGLAETIKHAVIRDKTFFEWLESHQSKVLDLDPKSMVELVVRNCRIKADVVSQDERESGLRGILNFGHTIGHTFETVKGGWDLHHGEAVSLGMAGEIQLSIKRHLITQADADRILELLKAFDLPTTIQHPLPIDDLLNAMKQDKKIRNGKITFALPKGIGDCVFVDDLNESEVRTAIESLKP